MEAMGKRDVQKSCKTFKGSKVPKVSAMQDASFGRRVAVDLPQDDKCYLGAMRFASKGSLFGHGFDDTPVVLLQLSCQQQPSPLYYLSRIISTFRSRAART